MAARAQPVGWPGAVALGLVLALVLGALGVLAAAGSAGWGLGTADWAALRFTLVQATLSAGLSVGLAIPLARALARRRFAGRSALVALLGAPFLLPAIVAVLGIAAVWGRSGWLADLGLSPFPLYGVQGVLLGHVFFNLPLAARLLLQGWAAIPGETWRVSASLGLGPGAVFRHIEWPMLRARVPGAFVLVFLVCASSFAVALGLGGGPGASTLEVAIFEAVRFSFDLGRAARLALVQVVLSLALGALAVALAREVGFGPGLGAARGHPLRRWDADGWGLRVLDAGVIGGAAMFLAAPLAAILVRGLEGVAEGLPPPVWPAAAVSVILAITSALLCLGLAWALAGFAADRPWGEAVGAVALAASPVAVGTGIFLAIRPWADPLAFALPVTASVNALMALPFALRLLLPALRRLRAEEGRLADALGMEGWSRARLVTLPALRRPLGLAGGLAAALSMGDLGVIALFAPHELATLPLVVSNLMGAFRIAAASGAALLLVGLAFALFWICDRLGGRA